MQSYEPILSAFSTKDCRVSCITQSCGIFCDSIQYRLNVGGGASDDPENLARGRLLLERFGEVAVAFLQFLKEPDVLDRDDGLVGKGLEQFHLRQREWMRVDAPGRQNADKLALLEKGNG
jgi:hypothetical protein